MLFFLATAFFFAPVVFSDKTFIARDNYIFYNPRQFFVAETIRSGILPLWNPYSACGVPCQASVQSSLWYPLSLLYYLLPFQTGFKYYIILHYFLGALFMFLLVRAWNGSRQAAFIAGLVFSFGGYLVSINDNVAFLTASVWTPLILLACHRLLERKSLPSVLLTGAAIALQIFAGDASFYLLSSLAATFLYLLWWITTQRHHRPFNSIKLLLCLFGSWLFGFLVAAVQLVPFIEFALRTHRYEGLSFAQVAKWSYHPFELLQLLIPYPFGSIVPGTRWFGQLWLDTVYIGIFPLVCAALFLFKSRHAIKPFLIALLGTGLFLALGEYNPLFSPMYRLLPGLSMLQYPVKFIFLSCLALSIMAGFGFEALCDLLASKAGARKLITSLILCIGSLLIILLLGFLQYDAGYASFLKLYPTNEYLSPISKNAYRSVLQGIAMLSLLLTAFLILTAGVWKQVLNATTALLLFLILLFLDLLCIGKPQDPYIPQTLLAQKSSTEHFLKEDPSLYRIYSLAQYQTKRSFLHVYYLPFERVYRIIRESLQANTNIYSHTYSAEEYSDLLITAFYDIFLPVEHCFKENRFDPEDIRYCSAIFSLLNVKYLLSPFPLNMFPFRLVNDGPIKIYENPMVLPRAFLVDRVSVVPTEEEVVRKIKSGSYEPGETAFMPQAEAGKLGDEIAALGSSSDNASFRGTVTIQNYTPNRIAVQASIDKPEMLILSDTYYPGWKAFDNGREVPVLRVNHTLRGIMMGKGDHDILFVFRPISLSIGAGLSLLSIAGAVIALLLTKSRLRTRHTLYE